MYEERKVLSSIELSNRTRVYYPEELELPPFFKENIEYFVEHVQKLMGARPFAIYVNNDRNNPERIHALKITFDKRDSLTLGDTMKS